MTRGRDVKTAPWALVVLAGAVLTSPGFALAARPMAILDQDRAEYAPGEVIVKFRAGTTPHGRRAAVAMRAHSAIAELQPGWAHVALRSGETVEEALSAYADDPAVEYAQPNYLYRALRAPGDPRYPQLWAFKNTGQIVGTGFVQPGGGLYPWNNPGIAGSDVNLEKAWDHITDCSGVAVAVVDTGVHYRQQDLAPNMWDGGPLAPNHGWDFVDGDADPMDLNGHGTHVAGVIGAAGNDGAGATGVCWNARIMAVRVLDASGSGSTASIVQGVAFAVDHGAKVINMSIGGGGPGDTAFSDALTAAGNAGAVVVVAAGNAGSNNETTPVYPCNFTHPNLICVAALDQAYELAEFSNYGARSVDVGAPGTNILSAWAGTNGSAAVSMTGWSVSSTTFTGWGYTVNGGNSFVVNPTTYPFGQYAAGTDDRAYRSLPVGAPDAAYASFGAVVDVRNGDYFGVACAGGGGDPFASGTLLGELTDLATYPYVVGIGGEIPPSCFGPAATFGLRLRSAPGSRARGLAVTGLTVTTLALTTTSYNTASGTSMATPVVAGLATMLRAYNPEYTAADVVSAILEGGRSVGALAGKTTSGKAVDAMRSLAHVRPPTGLAATIH